jgi:HK97 family phage major capsid protein
VVKTSQENNMAKTTYYEPLTTEMESALDSLNKYHRSQFQLLQDADRAAAHVSRKTPTLNLDRLFHDLSRGHLAGENQEALQESARRDGVTFDPVRPYISFRDLSVAVGASGGFFKQVDTQESIDILRPWSVMARAGIQIEFGLVGDQLIPKVTAKTTPNWLPTEATTGTASTPQLSQIALTPKNVIGSLNYSRQFSKQANAPQFAGRELLRTVGTAIDQAVLNGSGVSGQPTGIIGTAGVQTQSGTTLNAGCATMKRKSAEANVTDESISFLSTPAVRELLEGREKATGGGKFVWDKDLVADRAAYVSTDVPTAVMLCGDFSLIYVCFWGAGLVLEINPYEQNNFRAGIIQARVLVSCDVAVLHPPAFIVASSIT